VRHGPGGTGWQACEVRNTRDRLIAESRRFLEPGEAVAHVVRALEGPNRWLGVGLTTVVGAALAVVTTIAPLAIGVMALVYTAMYQRRLILSTDRRLLLLAGGRFRFSPKSVLEVLDLETRIGPLKGLFLRSSLAGRRLYIVARTAPEANASDADLED
jgi:hypothetical protein